MTIKQIAGVVGLVAVGAIGGLILNGDGTATADAATKNETLDTSAGEVWIHIKYVPTSDTCLISGTLTLPVAGQTVTRNVEPFQPVKASLRNGCAAVADLISRRAAAGYFAGVDAGE